MWHDANENLRPYIEFFQHSNKKYCFDVQESRYDIPAHELLELDTYYNYLSVAKWKKYTCVQSFQLNLLMEGEFSIELFAIYKTSKYPNFQSLAEYKYSLLEKDWIIIDIPETDAPIIAFRISTFTNTFFYEGYYSALVDEHDLRTVNISLVSTTFKKEKFILKNIEKLKAKLLNPCSELYQHVFVHIVDNGRTLNFKKLNQEYLKVYQNPNVGGSGGFSRGMLEALKMDVPQTHVLLMDDDIILEPESIIRTYHLLRMLKQEYQNYFISGAMFDYDAREYQYEDVGFVHVEDASYGPAKPLLDMRWTTNILENECLEHSLHENTYAGWWYCCIPVSQIKENGLPLPLFVRGDDVEFSLRNHAEFITLNGVCVWHVGFAGKFNASMELYQVHRNSLIIQSTSQICQEIDFIKRIKIMFWKEITRFAYNNAEQLLDAINDYLKGPDFLFESNGEKILKEHTKKNDKLFPLSDLKKEIKIPDEDPYGHVKLNFISKMLYVFTINGHLLPNFFLKNRAASIAYDWHFVPGKNFLRKKLIAINPEDKTGCIRTINRKKAFHLIKKYFETMSKYKKEKDKVTKKFQEYYSIFISETFWKQYLNIKQD